jgi:hypothetical protein
VRKKPGELVKPALRSSCSSRSSSAHGTTTSRKAVHFSETIEQVRDFLEKDRPSSISAESSPVDAYEDWVDSRLEPNTSSKSGHVEWTIDTDRPNDDCEAFSMNIRIERLKLLKDNEKLVGVVAITNVAYQKLVSVTFTFDSWETKSEIDAEYSSIGTKEILGRFRSLSICHQSIRSRKSAEQNSDIMRSIQCYWTRILG